MRVKTYTLWINLRGGYERVFFGLSRVAVKRYIAYFQEYPHYCGFDISEEPLA